VGWVGVVNIDSCASGQWGILQQASPVLKDLVRESLEFASDPTGKHANYYKFWENLYYERTKNESVKPQITVLGGGSDHAHFAFYAGVSAFHYELVQV
jgi:hypothetical protein